MHKSNGSVVIPHNAIVTVTQMNHLIEVQHMDKMNNRCPIKKLDKDTYLNLDTGAIEEFEHITTRKDSYKSLSQTFKKIRYLINNNFTGKGNELHVTLTYKENMTDTRRLYADFKRFITRLKRKYKNDSTIDYMVIVEPQERGAWHCHLLLRFNDLDNVFIPSNDLAEMWEQGFIKIKSLKDVDNIGAYLSAYLGDIELTEENVEMMYSSGRKIEVKEVEGKRYIKGGRLHLYPPGMRLFRKSSGIVYPERKKMKYENVKKIVGSAKPTYAKSIFVENEQFNNTINYEQYNLKRTNLE